MSALRYRSDIQGLRAIAVIAVMVFHFNPSWLPGGFVGVDLFLVISGFLITAILLGKKEQQAYSPWRTLSYFYTSRFKRIAPAYFVMLMAVALVAAVFFLPSDFEAFSEGLEQAALFFSNGYFAHFGDYFAPASHEQPLLHTWSLAVEIQFYLLAPFLILLLPLVVLRWTLWMLLLSLTLIAEYRLRVLGIEQSTYYSLCARLPEFFAGCLAALHLNASKRGERSRPWVGVVGLGLVLLAAVTQPTLGHFPGVAALLPVIGGVLLLINSNEGGIAGLLGRKGMAWIGALSYSLYLWHWPVLAFLRYYTGAEVLDLTFSLLFLILTFTLSLLSYHLVERPLRAKKTSKKQAIGSGVLLFSFLGTSQALANVNLAYTPNTLPIEYRRYAEPGSICHGKVVDDCLTGNVESDRRVLVLGDSHAAMLNHFFDLLGKELDLAPRVITASSCVTIPGFDYQRIAEWAQRACLDQLEIASKYLSETNVIFLAGMWSYQTQSEAFNQALRNFLTNYQDKKIYILAQVPKFSKNTARVHRFKELGFDVSLYEDESYETGNAVVSRIAREHENSLFLGFDKISFFDDAPFHRGKLIYSDAHHLNEVGAIAYAYAVKPELQALLLPKAENL